MEVKTAKTYQMILAGHEDQPVFLTLSEAKRHWKRYNREKFPKGNAFYIKQMNAEIWPISLLDDVGKMKPLGR